MVNQVEGDKTRSFMQQSSTEPVYLISVAAEKAGMHPQTLRQYDKLGLVSPSRTKGKGRRYSERDVEMLKQVQYLSQTLGVNLAGIKHILQLREALFTMREQMLTIHAQNQELYAQIQILQRANSRVFTADANGFVSTMSPTQPTRRRQAAPPANRQISSHRLGR